MATALAEQLRAAFGNHEFQAETAPVSLSIGIASLHSAQDLPLEQLISQADRALYRAKLQGRNRVEVLALDEPCVPAENASGAPTVQDAVHA
jgi:diguanylate cyclase (GGDEF)-like protein